MGETGEELQAAYRQLFKYHVSEATLTEIRAATNKAWVLGGDKFKQRVQQQLERRVVPDARGGGRKLDHYRKHSQRFSSDRWSLTPSIGV